MNRPQCMDKAGPGFEMKGEMKLLVFQGLWIFCMDTFAFLGPAWAEDVLYSNLVFLGEKTFPLPEEDGTLLCRVVVV